MKRKVQKGFTLIELTIAMFTGAVVIVAAGMILFFGQKTWNSTWDRANLQRDASYAMLRMSRSVKAATSAQVEGSGKGLKIFNEGGWMRFFLSPATEKYTLKGEDGETNFVTILDGNVEDLQFNVTGNLVRIEVKLSKDNLQTHLVSTVMMRNYGSDVR